MQVKRLNLNRLVLTFVAVMSSVSLLKADIVIFDNLAATTYDPSVGYTISNAYHQSESFVATNTANLSQVLIAMWDAGSNHGFDLTLTDSLSTVLESWTDIPAPPVGANLLVVDIFSVSHPLLTEGQTYTLAATGTIDVLDVWDRGGTVSLNPPEAAFRVLGTSAVPEPSSLTLWGLGIASFGGIFSLKKWRATVAPVQGQIDD